MSTSAETIADRSRARDRLKDLIRNPVTLPRSTYFVPGWRDEQGHCWKTMEAWLPLVIANAKTHVHFLEFVAPDGGPIPPWEDFLDFADDLAHLVHHDTAGAAEFDLVGHSMGGLDSLAAIALLGNHPELPEKPVTNVHTVITYDTPFLGFASAESDLLKKFVTASRQDPWVLLQLAAMQKNSKRIAEVALARDAFLAGVSEFWPRGADNYDGLLEVEHDSAKFGGPESFGPNVRGRYHAYATWGDTTHSGVNGVTQDLRAVLETVQILTGTRDENADLFAGG